MAGRLTCTTVRKPANGPRHVWDRQDLWLQFGVSASEMKEVINQEENQ